MNELEKNINIIKEIISYCDEIQEARERFGNSYEALSNDKHYQNSVSMCILQIGELTGLLTEDFRKKYDGVPWRDIKNMRNITAHDYKSMILKILWEVISKDIIDLCEYCEKIIEGIKL
jgi:uncharacterized protein with HEPN domain